MNKKGVTLVELIAVLVIMGLIATILLPNMNKIIQGSKRTAGNIQESEIIEAAKNYLADNIEDSITFDNNSTAYITLEQLLDGGYLSREPKEPKTGDSYDLTHSKVIVTKNNNKYKYTLSLIVEELDELEQDAD